MAVRWGIVSAGKISSDFVNAINSYPGNYQVVAAVAARDRSRAEEFAKLHNISNVFDSYKAMAESTGIIDVAYIGSLNPEHYALSKLFLENGKHVLCEKPLCLNSKQAQALDIDIAKNKKVFFMEGIWSRFSPAYIALKKEIDSGKLGEVKLVEVNLGAPIDTVDRLSKKSLGGGAVLDLGVYTIQMAQFIFNDEPTKVIATGALNEEGVDVMETIILEYSGGRRAVLNLDATMKLWNKATVTGSKGRATLEEPFHFPNTLTHVDGKVENFTLHTSNIPYNFENSAGLVYESLEVTRCIKEGLLESPHVTHRDSLIIARIQDSIRKQLGVHFDVDD
ncbi:trans-1,2-dihydrobenzene-1,2-diol dehydrogenase-like isoform X2 [Leguminivora glycinivorella]|uniref:trans-1,2-dihydrobenzene-1,2-diol dehydrogenase-like isoform X2 n=1 Tax=Leguminivora glycinivorella TaxID=1035111 RepID=UPI00200CA57E|nr:trans-1,2-dihydrobenzene-1,2-diol dehydrogenase-like isoform X2 [Leguminivora glycinivorella]